MALLKFMLKLDLPKLEPIHSMDTKEEAWSHEAITHAHWAVKQYYGVSNH